jgi:ribosome-binding factor A
VNLTRQQQILSLIKRLVSIELQEINHELFHSAVITDALLSNDGKICRIWVDAKPQLVTLLNSEYQHQIQHNFTKKFYRKIVPKLIFLKDDGEMDHLNSLFESIK